MTNFAEPIITFPNSDNRMKCNYTLLLLTILFLSWTAFATEYPPKNATVDCYLPIEGGWSIHLSSDPDALRVEPGDCIGVVDRASSYGEGHAFYRSGGGDNPRLHRRPLYPPADKSLVWIEKEREEFKPYSYPIQI